MGHFWRLHSNKLTAIRLVHTFPDMAHLPFEYFNGS